MAGVTEKKKKEAGKYLLLHRSGAIVRTKSLNIPQPLMGITAIINLETLEQLNDDEKWEKIPIGCETLIAAEEAEDDESFDEDDEQDEDGLSPLTIQSGARRCFNPHVVWAYCRIRD